MLFDEDDVITLAQTPAGHTVAEPVRIFIVEDQPTLRANLRQLLELEAYAVEEAPDGGTALARLAALASHLKMSDRGDVLLCLVQDVRKMKGAALGMVLVDKVLRIVRPNIDPALEDRLRVELSA